MKKIAALLHTSIKSDYRVVKTIRTLANEYEIDLFFHGKMEDEGTHFKDFPTIKCFALNKNSGWKTKILKHSLFCYEYSHLAQIVLKSNRNYNYLWANDLPTLQPALAAAKKLQAKVIYDSHEIYTETINQFFLKQKSPFKNVLFKILTRVMRWHGKNMEKKMLHKTFLMFTVNDSLKSYFEKNYKLKNVHVLMNLPYQTRETQENAFNFRAHFSWPKDSTVVLYQGVLNAGRGLNIMIDAFNHLADNFRLVILGSGILKNQLIDQVTNNHLEHKVGFLDAVSLTVLPEYTKGADLGMNLLEEFNLSKKLASPNKLFEYIHAGIPVVASKTIENKKVFENYDIGALCDNNPQDIALKIQQVATLKLGFQENLEHAKNAFSWEKQERYFLDTIATNCNSF